VLLIGSVIAGHWVAQSGAAGALTFTPHEITILMAIYGLVASVLPVWLVLEPRDYLSTYVKLGTIAVLVVGVFMVHPNIKFPNFTPFVHGGGPIIKGSSVPISFRDHCLRRDLGFSLAGRLRHHAEDAGQGK
jgi:carbon starvation protein